MIGLGEFHKVDTIVRNPLPGYTPGRCEGDLEPAGGVPAGGGPV